MHEEVEKGRFIFISKDEFEDYIRDNFRESVQGTLKRIVNYCFDNKATASFLFIDHKRGDSICKAYLPIYNNEAVLKQYVGNFKNIDDSIYLAAFAVDDIDDLKDRAKLEIIKERASRLGFWHIDYWSNEDYAILVFC